MSDAYKLYVADSPEHVLPLGNWLNDHARHPDQRVYVAVREGRNKKLAFAAGNEVWVVDLKSQAAPLFYSAVLRQVEHGQITLAARDLFSDLIALSKMLAAPSTLGPKDVFWQLAPLFDGDLLSAGQTIDLPVQPKEFFKKIEDDAYDLALLEPQYRHQIPAYYDKIAVPFAKLQAEAVLHGQPEMQWWLGYEDLWLKVLAHYAEDPTLKWAFAEGRKPLESIARMLELSLPTTEALMLWQCHGRDMPVFSQAMPEMMEFLPAALPAYGLKLDRALPNICAATLQMQQAYWESRLATTRYNRKLRPGKQLGQAVAFRIFGTVEELIAVAAVAIWRNRTSSDIIISKIQGGPESATNRVGGVGPADGKYAWATMLKRVSPLNNPLSIPLNASVVEV